MDAVDRRRARERGECPKSRKNRRCASGGGKWDPPQGACQEEKNAGGGEGNGSIWKVKKETHGWEGKDTNPGRSAFCAANPVGGVEMPWTTVWKEKKRGLGRDTEQRAL